MTAATNDMKRHDIKAAPPTSMEHCPDYHASGTRLIHCCISQCNSYHVFEWLLYPSECRIDAGVVHRTLCWYSGVGHFLSDHLFCFSYMNVWCRMLFKKDLETIESLSCNMVQRQDNSNYLIL